MVVSNVGGWLCKGTSSYHYHLSGNMEHKLHTLSFSVRRMCRECQIFYQHEHDPNSTKLVFNILTNTSLSSIWDMIGKMNSKNITSAIIHLFFLKAGIWETKQTLFPLNHLWKKRLMLFMVFFFYTKLTTWKMLFYNYFSGLSHSCTSCKSFFF